MDIREEVLEMKKEVEEIQEESLAMSLLKDYKKDYKKVNERMFKIIVILIICWLLTIAGIIFYSCLPSEETSQESNGQHISQEEQSRLFPPIDKLNILLYN